MQLGIESIHVYTGRAFLSVRDLFRERGLDTLRFDNLMMEQKSVSLPCEDPVTNGVNAAKPIVDALSPSERERIEAVIVGTESGLDYGKPISTYIHHHLGLGRRCRSFEVKHACYGGTAALQTAIGLLTNSAKEHAKALVIATDAASAAARNTYWEPSQGAGAVAMLVSDQPEILELDRGASGYCSYEVMDTCRPRPDLEAGDSDLSLLSYLQCLEESFGAYRDTVEAADFETTFDYLVLHTPFAGMVKGAHRMLLRKLKQATTETIARDFHDRVEPSLAYCVRVGNIYSAALYLALCSLIDHGDFEQPRRIGLFSYGSGCASEFFSGVVTHEAQRKRAKLATRAALDDRHALSMKEYELISGLRMEWLPGLETRSMAVSAFESLYQTCFAGRGDLVLTGVHDFHREYEWS